MCAIAGLPSFGPEANSPENAENQQTAANLVIPPPAQFAVGSDVYASNEQQSSGQAARYTTSVVYKPTPPSHINTPALVPAPLASDALSNEEQLRLQLRRNSASAAAVSAAYGAPPSAPSQGQGSTKVPKMANGTAPSGGGLGGGGGAVAHNSIKPSNLFGSVRAPMNDGQQRPGAAQVAFEPPRDYDGGGGGGRREEDSQLDDRNFSSQQRVNLPPADYDQPSSNRSASTQSQLRVTSAIECTSYSKRFY